MGSPTTNYGWTKPTVGADTDAWGGEINTDLDGIDSVVFGKLDKTGGTLTGALTPSQTAGIVGTTTNNNAASGSIGEHIQVDQLTNVSLVNNTAKTVVSISLTAGDWDVEGSCDTVASVGMTTIISALSLGNNAFTPAINTGWMGSSTIQLTTAAMVSYQLPTGSCRVSIAATTTVYLVLQATFASGTCVAQGSIKARRIR